jgi:hypothetical protein
MSKTDKIMIWVMVLALVVSLVFVSTSFWFDDDKCSDKVIKEHIISLTHKYTEEEKEALVPRIKEFRGCN